MCIANAQIANAQIANFQTPVADTFKNFFSTLGDGSDKHKKTVLMMCLLLPIIKQLILQLSYFTLLHIVYEFWSSSDIYIYI